MVLSAGRVTAPGPAAVSEWGDSGRFFGGIELFREGRAPPLASTGGAVASRPTDPLEGGVLKGVAADCGVPPREHQVRCVICTESTVAIEVLHSGRRKTGHVAADALAAREISFSGGAAP